MKITCYLIIALFISCTHSKFDQNAKATKIITFEYECPTQDISDRFLKNLKNKIERWESEVTIQKITTTKLPRQFNLHIVKVEDETAFLDYLQSTTRIDFWHIYTPKDLPEFGQLMGEENMPWKNAMKFNFPMFLYKPAIDTAAVNDLLAVNRDLFPKDLIWKWGKMNDAYSATTQFPLYALKGKPILTSTCINEAKTTFSEYTNEPIINMSFDKKGTETWAQMTTQAYADNKRAIGIMVDGVLESVPSVVSPITNGQTTIAGIPTEEETKKIVAGLSDGAFNYCDLKIVSIKNIN